MDSQNPFLKVFCFVRFINTNTKNETMKVNFIINWKHTVGFADVKYKDNLLDKQIYETPRRRLQISEL